VEERPASLAHSVGDKFAQQGVEGPGTVDVNQSGLAQNFVGAQPVVDTANIVHVASGLLLTVPATTGAASLPGAAILEATARRLPATAATVPAPAVSAAPASASQYTAVPMPVTTAPASATTAPAPASASPSATASAPAFAAAQYASQYAAVHTTETLTA